jgi:hypothetical protein
MFPIEVNNPVTTEASDCTLLCLGRLVTSQGEGTAVGRVTACDTRTLVVVGIEPWSCFGVVFWCHYESHQHNGAYIVKRLSDSIQYLYWQDVNPDDVGGDIVGMLFKCFQNNSKLCSDVSLF